MYGNFLARACAAITIASLLTVVAAAQTGGDSSQPPHDMQHMHAANEPRHGDAAVA